jgi:cilia- and flagella-associated protein 57
VNEEDVVPTSIALSRSGRMLFIGTSKGTIRSYKFPLTNPSEYQEHLSHSSSVTRMKVTFSDEYMISSADDGTVLIWKIQDKEGRTIKRDKDFSFAEEILITKSDLEEKNTLMKDLNNRVKELKSENEYALRLKELSNSEKIKELTDKFIQEMENLKTKIEILKSEKQKAESNHEYVLSELREQHGKELHDLEATSNTKLMVEFEKYQELQNKTQANEDKHEKELRAMEESRTNALNELEQKYKNEKQKLEDEKYRLSEEIKQMRKEYEETQRQIEEDADTEIIDIKTKYEKRLREQIELNEKIMNEAGNIKKRVTLTSFFFYFRLFVLVFI